MAHSPFRPARFEFWYCAWCRRALCRQGWLPEGHPDRWAPFKPGLLWKGSREHWQPSVLLAHSPDGTVRAYRRPG